jgi:hypothetical protein
MYDGMMAESVLIAGHGGDEIAAYLARLLGPGPYPGVVVVHHMPGSDDGTKEITRRFATRGYVAICPHLHYREGPDASPDDAAMSGSGKGPHGWFHVVGKPGHLPHEWGSHLCNMTSSTNPPVPAPGSQSSSALSPRGSSWLGFSPFWRRPTNLRGCPRPPAESRAQFDSGASMTR